MVCTLHAEYALLKCGQMHVITVLTIGLDVHAVCNYTLHGNYRVMFCHECMVCVFTACILR